MDVAAVEAAVRRAAAAARKGGGPQFLELRTYRFRAHSMYDAELYRSKQEVGEWMHRDPIVLYETRLRADGIARGLRPRERSRPTSPRSSTARSPRPRPARWEPVEELGRNLYAPEGAT